MSSIGKREIMTQQRVIDFFRNALGYENVLAAEARVRLPLTMSSMRCTDSDTGRPALRAVRNA